MTLPRLPPALGGGDSVRRVMAQVPPTPTRLALLHNAPAASHLTVPSIPGISGRSPPAASVPISSALVPPTPASLHHPGYSGDKSAFLAPFEVFYDALNDSKQLKNWLSDQLQRSNTLMQNLAQQQEKMDEVVRGLVEREMVSVRAEVTCLHRRVEELEDAVRVARADLTTRHQSMDHASSGRPKSKVPVRAAMPAGPLAPETYTFPAVSADASRRREPASPPPGWGDEERRDTQEGEGSTPARRLSVSATRLDPHRPPPTEAMLSRRSSLLHSPPQSFRDSGGFAPSHSKGPGPSACISQPLADAHRPHPHPRVGAFRYPQSDIDHKSTTPPRDSRRNSVIMSPPDRPCSSTDDT